MPLRESIGRRIAVATVLTTTSLVLTLAVLELVLRVITPAPPPLSHPPPAPVGLPELRSVMELARANTRGVMPGGVPYRTNSSGFRGPDYARPKPAGTFRIAVIGDSVAMGSGVPEEETYAARIEHALNNPPGPITYEVLNVSLAGLNATNVVEHFVAAGLSYEPDLILYGYTLNDIEGPGYRRSQDPDNHLMGNLTREDWERNRIYLTTFFRTRFYSLRELLWPPYGSYVWELDDNYLDNPGALAAVDKAFDRLHRIAADRGACIVLMQHTSLWFLRGFHPFRRHHAVVAHLAAAHGFTNKDTVDYFMGRDALSLWVNPFDPHPNSEGHAILSRAALDALHALPSTCWQHR